MNLRPILAAALLIAGAGLIGYLMWDRRPVPLIPLPEAPHGPVAADRSAPKPNLLGLTHAASAHVRGDDARLERNRLAHAWIAALADLEAGRMNQGAVERLEMELSIQRLHTGEVKADEAHARLAELMARELQRRKTLFAAGFASPDDVRQAEVLLARERHSAGDAKSGYAATRQEYLAARRKHFLLLVRSGLMLKDVAEVEIELLELELPEPDTLREPAGPDPR